MPRKPAIIAGITTGEVMDEMVRRLKREPELIDALVRRFEWEPELTDALVCRLKREPERPAKRATRAAAKAAFTSKRLALAIMVESKWSGCPLTKKEIAARSGCTSRNLERCDAFTMEWNGYREHFKSMRDARFPRPPLRTVAFYDDDERPGPCGGFEDLRAGQKAELQAIAEGSCPPGRDLLCLIAGLNGERTISVEQAAKRLGITIDRAEKIVDDVTNQLIAMKG